VGDSPSEAVRSQPNPVGGEGVGFDDFGARGDVGAVDGLNQITLAQVELVKAAFVGHTLGVQLGAHAAIEQNGRTRGLTVEKSAAHSERNSVLGTRVALHYEWPVISGQWSVREGLRLSRRVAVPQSNQ